MTRKKRSLPDSFLRYKYIKTMKTHFVCRGNTYRSRLAEAYYNSLQLLNASAVSSGIEATDNLNGPITVYAARILAAHGLTSYGKATWTQSTKENLEESDVVVFMNEDVYIECRDKIKPVLQKFYVWSVEDVNPRGLDADTVESLTNATFTEIVEEVSNLVRMMPDDN